MDRIKEIWFGGDRIYMRTDTGNVYSRPLEAFPTLKDASEADRNRFIISKDGDAVRWEQLDEDIHISSFYETAEPHPDNEIARIFSRFPVLNITEVAHEAGMSKSLLSKYIYGMKQPNEKRKAQIKGALHSIGQKLATV